MTTTKNFIKASDSPTLAFSLAIDGYNLVYTDNADTTGIATAWSATSWTNVKTGLMPVGELSQEIDLYDPAINADSLSFRILDHDDTLLTTILREANSSANKTWLTASLDSDDTSATVANATGFAPTIYCGHECMTAGGSDATSFTSLTRGVLSLHSNNSGTAFSRSHVLDYSVTNSEANCPIVSSAPRTWYNRGVVLYVHHWENGIWSTKANSLLLWSGSIKSWADNGDGSVTLTCSSIKEKLQSTLMANQWRGWASEGLYVKDHYKAVHFGFTIGNNYYSVDGSLSSVDQFRNYEQVFEEVKAIIDGITLPVTVTEFSFDLIYPHDVTGPRVSCRIKEPNIDVNDHSFLLLHPKICELLGFSENNIDDDTAIDTNGYKVRQAAWGFSYTENPGSETIAFQSSWAPKIVMDTPSEGELHTISREVGLWTNQTSTGLPQPDGTTNGMVTVGDKFYQAYYTNGSPSSIIFRARTPFTFYNDTDYFAIREGDGSQEAPEIKQVFCELGPVGTTLLKIILSTGSNGYNHVTYDTYSTSIGLAIPASLVNISSFEALNIEIPDYLIYIDKPTPFKEILESVLALTNRHLIFTNGKLTLVKLGVGAVGVDNAIAVTESSKAKVDDRIQVRYGLEGIINKAILKYDYDTKENKFRREENVFHLSSIQDYEQVKSITVEAKGMGDAQYWRDNVASSALAYFSKPAAVFERTYNQAHIDLTPGDIILLSDNYMADPATGTRGVTQLPCWVTSTSWDWKAASGKFKAIYIPEVSTNKIRAWAPSALVNIAAADGGYHSTNKELTTTRQYYSTGTDASYFSSGDVVRIIELDPTSASAPETCTDTIVSIAGEIVKLTSGIVTWTSTKNHVIEYDAISNVQATQRTHPFIADDATFSTGYAANDAYKFGLDSQGDAITCPALDYTKQAVFRSDIEDDTGQPVSVHEYYHLIENLNNYLSYKSNQVPVNTAFHTSEMSNTGTTSRLVYGPIPAPVYGYPNRGYKVKLYTKFSGGSAGGYCKVISSKTPVIGSSETATLYDERGVNSSISSFSHTSYDWIDGGEIVPSVGEFAPSITWFTVELYGRWSTDVCYFRGITVGEGEI